MNYFKLVGLVLVVLAFGVIFVMDNPTANVIGGSIGDNSIDPTDVDIANLVNCAEMYAPACGGYCVLSSTTTGMAPSGSESSTTHRGTETWDSVSGSESSARANPSETSTAVSGSESSTSVSGSESWTAHGSSTTTLIIGQCRPAPSGGCSCQP